MTDARDEVTKNYKGVAAVVRGVDTATPADVVRQRLSDSATRLSVTG